MNTRNFFYTLLALLALSFAACDEDSAFDGGDNYLASFALVQNGNQYTAVIGEGKITVTVPENLELTDVTVEYTCSEHAKLSPDPASIEDWEQPQTFTVTSYNGRSQTYNYTLKRSAVTLEEGINLRSDAEIAAFAEKQVSRIEGSLIIGMKEAFSKADSITTLAPLASLKEVTGNIKIYATFNGTSLEGLENLEHIGGIELVYPENNNNSRPDFKNLRRIELNSLTTVDSDLKLIADTLDIFSFPKLTTVGRHAWIEGNGIRALQAPKLQTVGGDFLLGSARWYGNWQFEYLEKVNLPELTTVAGNFSIKRTEALKECHLPKLTSVLDFSLGTSRLEVLDISQLSEITGKLSITSMPLTELKLSQLQKVEELELQNLSELKELALPIEELNGRLKVLNMPKLETLNLDKLTKVGGDLQIESCPMLKELNSLAKLKEVSGALSLNNLSGLEELSGLRSLTTVGGEFRISLPTDRTLDLSAFDGLTSIGGLSWSGDAMQSELNAFNGLQHINGGVYLSDMPNATSLSGFRSLQSCADGSYTFQNMSYISDLSAILSKAVGATIQQISITNMGHLATLDLRGINVTRLYLNNIQAPLKVIGDPNTNLGINHSGSNSLALEGIEELGDLYIGGMLPETGSMEFRGLKRVKTQLQINQTTDAPQMKHVRFPDLVSVGTYLTISSNLKNPVPVEFPNLEEISNGSINYYGMASMNFPKLRKVSANFTISTAYISGKEVIMMEADNIHLPALETVGALIVTTNTYNASQYNTTLTNLNFLSGVKKVTGKSGALVQVNRQSSLTDFTGLKNVIEGLTQASQWSVNTNAYNPTFEQAKAGKLTQE